MLKLMNLAFANEIRFIFDLACIAQSAQPIFQRDSIKTANFNTFGENAKSYRARRDLCTLDNDSLRKFAVSFVC